jgi:hypothetical protein
LPLGPGLLQGFSFGLKSNGVVVGKSWRGFVATKIFILLKKIVVDVDKMNDIPQFSLMLPGEE